MELLGAGTRLRHPSYQEGVVIKLNQDNYEICFMAYGIKSISKNYDRFEIIELIPATTEVDYSDFERSLIKILRNWSAVTELVELGDKWRGGKMILVPANKSLKEKEIPVETFFHKIVMLRDRIRVMEQKINSSKLMTDADKIELQQYITRMYGSLTTFNVLFRNTEDNFVGEKTGNE